MDYLQRNFDFKTSEVLLTAHNFKPVRWINIDFNEAIVEDPAFQGRVFSLDIEFPFPENTDFSYIKSFSLESDKIYDVYQEFNSRISTEKIAFVISLMSPNDFPNAVELRYLTYDKDGYKRQIQLEIRAAEDRIFDLQNKLKSI